MKNMNKEFDIKEHNFEKWKEKKWKQKNSEAKNNPFTLTEDQQCFSNSK